MKLNYSTAFKCLKTYLPHELLEWSLIFIFIKIEVLPVNLEALQDFHSYLFHSLLLFYHQHEEDLNKLKILFFITFCCFQKIIINHMKAIDFYHSMLTKSYFFGHQLFASLIQAFKTVSTSIAVANHTLSVNHPSMNDSSDNKISFFNN